MISKQNSISRNYSLRSLHLGDANWVFEACQDSEIQKWTEIPKPYTRDHADGFTRTLAGDVEVWVIESSSSERPFGVIGVHSINHVTRVALIGYWIAPWGRKQGAMKNGLLQLIAKMKSRSEVGSIEATIAESNIASRKSIESAGFKLIGSADRSCNCGGEEVSAVQYEYVLKASLLGA